MSQDIPYFTAEANEVLNIIFVNSIEDMQTKRYIYKPKMTHQIFEKESIFGYCDLCLNLYYSCYTYHCYVELLYEDVWEEDRLGMRADNVIDSLSPWLRESMVLNKSDFINILNTCDKKMMFGEVLREFNHKILGDKNKVIKASINNCDINDKEFKMLHQRFESLIIMYIDAANFIDFSDINWRVIYLYEKKIVEPNVIYYSPIGFCTIYIFNTKKVGRISQFFIIPKYQRKGLGFIFLKTVYEYLRSSRLSLKKITVESPNELFTDLRDKVDVTLCMDLPIFNRNLIKNGFTNEMYVEASLQFKLSKKQVKKVYNILRAYYCESGTDDFEKFDADFIREKKLEILGLEGFSPNDKDEFLDMFQEEILIEAANINKSFDIFMKSIENVLKYLKRKKHHKHVGA